MTSLRKMGKLSSLFSGLLAGLMVFSVMGNSPFHTTGLSPYQVSVEQWKDGNFHRFLQERNNQAIQFDQRVKEKILRVISRYKTGLDQQLIEQIPSWIIEESRKYNYDPLFLTALIITESSFYNWARSRVGALGLMQIRPTTGLALAQETRVPWKGKPTLYDPGTNIALGAYYLNKLLVRFGDLSLALEAYNHGPSRLNRFLKKGHTPKRYSRKVFKNYTRIRSLRT